MPQSRYTTLTIIIGVLLFLGAAVVAWPFTVDEK
jgi:hypothetical protein